MNILEAINNHKSDYKGDFCLIIKGKDGSKISEISGYFTKSGQSIYAHNQTLGLVAGSQAKNESEAMIKAIMRLVQMIAINILHSNTEQQSQADDNLKEFIEFVKKGDFIQLNDDLNIPVYTEQLEKTEDGYNYLLRRLKNSVTDLENIQEAKYDLLAENEVINILTEKRTIANTKKEYELISCAG